MFAHTDRVPDGMLRVSYTSVSTGSINCRRFIAGLPSLIVSLITALRVGRVQGSARQQYIRIRHHGVQFFGGFLQPFRICKQAGTWIIPRALAFVSPPATNNEIVALDGSRFQ